MAPMGDQREQERKTADGHGIHPTWFGGFLVHLVLVASWTLGGAAVFGFCALTAGYTYGISFLVFLATTMKQRRTRQAWAVACLVLCAILGPRTLAAQGFWRFWMSWVCLSFSGIIAWFWDFEGRPWVRKLVNDLGFHKYYAECELRGALSDIQESRSVFLFHPHGILGTGFSVNGAWGKKFHELAGADTVHLIDKVLRDDNPFFKVVCDVHGGIETLNKDSLQNALKVGRNVSFIPGGFEDATIMSFGTHRTAMRKRTGFIKYALQHGSRLHPIYTFGESDTYYTFSGLLSLRLWLNKFGVPAVLFFGFPLMPMLPRPQAKLVTCVGKAVELPRIAAPTKEDITKWHQVYCDALDAVFEEHKHHVGLPKASKLDIW